MAGQWLHQHCQHHRRLRERTHEQKLFAGGHGMVGCYTSIYTQYTNKLIFFVCKKNHFESTNMKVARF